MNIKCCRCKRHLTNVEGASAGLTLTTPCKNCTNYASVYVFGPEGVVKDKYLIHRPKEEAMSFEELRRAGVRCSELRRDDLHRGATDTVSAPVRAGVHKTGVPERVAS